MTSHITRIDDGNKISIQCVRGIQSGREYYTAMMPLPLVGRMLDDGSEDHELDPIYRTQRKTNSSRAKKIAQYIHDNVAHKDCRQQYVLPALTVSIDADVTFTSAGKGTDGEDMRIGVLVIPADAKLLVNDGLHRRAGIVAALRSLDCRERRKMTKAEIKAYEARRETLMYESIPVTIYVAAGTASAQQMFVDINKNASKPNSALSMTFDHRDKYNALARTVAREAFPNQIEFERATASDGKLFSINALVAAIKTLCEAWYEGEPDEKELVEFFKVIATEMAGEWYTGKKLMEVLTDAEATPSLARQNIALEAIAIALATQDNWKTLAKRLKRIDWSRDDERWEKCHVVVDGRILKTRKSTQAMGNAINRSVRARSSKGGAE